MSSSFVGAREYIDVQFWSVSESLRLARLVPRILGEFVVDTYSALCRVNILCIVYALCIVNIMCIVYALVFDRA